MVVLLIGMAVMAIWMSAALPAWRQQAIREKEAELIFRGEQYARAIFLYRQENGQAPPPNIDTLVNRKYLRKKYLDPITGKDFVPVAGVSVSPPGPGGSDGQAQVVQTRGLTSQMQTGITGVRSTSTEESIIRYQNQQVYNQFPFDWTFEAMRAGVMGPINLQPDGGSPDEPGGRAGPGEGGFRGGNRGRNIRFGADQPAGRDGQTGRGRQGGGFGRGPGQE